MRIEPPLPPGRITLSGLMVGDHVDARGQVVVIACTVDAHPGLAAWLAGQPPGLVHHRPWLHRPRLHRP